MSADEKKMIGMIGARDAEILESRLAKHGIEVATIYNHSTCKTGCSPSKEIWAHAEDIPVIQQIIHDEHVKVLQDMGADMERINQVFDPENPTAVCPACGTEFSTHLGECSDCGLAFG
jgi:hypothetical protein